MNLDRGRCERVSAGERRYRVPETDRIIGYGFYSQEAEELYGGVQEYLTPAGESVRVTSIALDPAGNGYQWDDKVAMGPVVKWVRTVVESRAGRVVGA